MFIKKKVDIRKKEKEEYYNLKYFMLYKYICKMYTLADI